MTTFSQLVDDLVLELGRPDYRTSLVNWTNQTIREVHFRPQNNAPIKFHANRYEDDPTVDTDGVWLWPLPSVTRFQALEAIYHVSRGIYVPEKTPKVSNEFSFAPDSDVFWYRAQSTIAISGVATDDVLKLSWFMFPRVLSYKVSANRITMFDPDTDQYVLTANTAVPATDEQLELETNWILQRWPDTIREGVRSKAWRRSGDGDRARMSFSAAEAARMSLWDTEPAS